MCVTATDVSGARKTSWDESWNLSDQGSEIFSENSGMLGQIKGGNPVASPTVSRAMTNQVSLGKDGNGIY